MPSKLIVSFIFLTCIVEADIPTHYLYNTLKIGMRMWNVLYWIIDVTLNGVTEMGILHT